MSSAAGQRVPTLKATVLSAVSKFIGEFQPQIFETLNKNVQLLKCANYLFRGLGLWSKTLDQSFDVHFMMFM